MQCAMQKIYIPGVRLAVPQHIYDELGLHLNQTVMVSNSQSFRELDTRENVSALNSSDEAPNHYDKPLLTQPEINDESMDGEADKSSLEKHDGTFLAFVVNTENGKQIITTQNLKTSSLLSNSQTTCKGDTSEDATSEDDTSEDESTSNSSDDADTSSGKLHTVSCDTPVLTEPEINKSNEGTTNQSSSGSHKAFQGMSTSPYGAGNEVRKGLYPRICAKCNRRYTSKGSFSNHKKNCDRYVAKVDISYPRCCTNCNRSYSSMWSFSKHKGKCEEFKRQAEYKSMNSTICCEHGHEWHKVNANASNTENEKELYTTNCATCASLCSVKVSVCDPGKKCGENEKRKKISYPRTCTVCNKSFFSKSAFSYHKRHICNPFKRQTNNHYLIRESSSLSFSELNTCENDVNTSSSDLYGLPNESQALSDQEKPANWIPVTIDSGKAQTYFVVKKTSP